MTRVSRYKSLSLPRRWIGDLAYFASKVPTVGGAVVIRVSDVAEARRQCQPLIGWNAILVKAIALTAMRQPELRQTYMPWPWPHLYQHPSCVATIVVEREWRGAPGTFFGKIKQPELRSLRDIDSRLRDLKRKEVEEVFHFRRLLRLTRYPLFLRRLVWRLAFSFSGRLKMHQFGTFSVNSIGGRDVFVSQSLALAALSWFYGPPMPDGTMHLQIFFDHRVIDGAAVKRIANELAATLNSEIIAELRAGG
ncbi:MAG: acyltransferase [Rhodobiaceae bacterium]|nr:acyltransferase [Rhodobiaceae bacterium]